MIRCSSGVEKALKRGVGSLKVDTELDFHGVATAKIAAGIVSAELLLVGSHMAVNGGSDCVEDVRWGANIKVHLQGGLK